MKDEYTAEFTYDRAGKYVTDFLKSYIDRYGLKVDTNRSTDKSLYFLGRNGEYAGTVSNEDGISKYMLYLNTEGTLILTGEVNEQYISGAVEQLNLRDRGTIEALTLFSIMNFEDHNECTETHYTGRVTDVSKRIIPAPTNWSWKDIKNLFTIYREQLTPRYARTFEDVSYEDFMRTMMVDFESEDYYTPKAV